MDQRPATAPASSLSEIRFGLLSPADIVSLSVRSISKPADVSDPCLGLPCIRGSKCLSCGANEPKECPGHFGRLELVTPVYHPEHLRKLCKVLGMVCLKCGKPRKKPGRKEEELDVKEEKDEEDEAKQQEQTAAEKGKAIVKHSSCPAEAKQQEQTAAEKGKAIVKHSSCPAGINDPTISYFTISDSEDEGLFIVDIMAEDAKRARCEFCDGSYKYPNVRVLSMKFQKYRIEGIRMECPGTKPPPNGYWNFLGGALKGRRKVKLTPIQASALSILKKVPARVLPGVDVEAFVLEMLPVPPNCMQSLLDPRTGNVSFSSSGAIQTLRKVVMENAKFVDSSPKALKTKWKTLQHLISQYLRLKGCPKIRNNLEPLTRPGVTVKCAEIWKNNVTDTILSKMTQYCAIALLTGDAYLGVEEILIPDEISRQVTLPERVTGFNADKLQAIVNDLQVGFIEQNGVTCDLRGQSAERRQLEIGAVVHRPVRDGDLVFVSRHPAVYKHSVIALIARIHPGKSFRINPLVCSPLKGDFDGDRLHVYFPQAEDARVETKELMGLKQQFQALSSGNPVISLTQDMLVAAYILVSRHIFFTAPQMQQLALHADRWSLPDPAIVKPLALWTGFQAFGLLLPSELAFSTRTGVLISDGELVTAGDDGSWLGGGTDSLLRAIHEKFGVAEAIGYLDSCCSMLKEFLHIEGFSIGLGDFNVSDRQREAISELLAYAKENYVEEQDFRDVERCLEVKIKNQTRRGNRLHMMMKAGSKGSASSARIHVACLGVQVVHGRSEFIDKSFWSGLDPSEFWQHSVCTRATLLKSLTMHDAGTLASTLMNHLEDVYLAYDGTVRHRQSEQVVQLVYGNESAQPGEAVGALAASFITEQAYDTAYEDFKKTLQSSVNEDKVTILRLERCGINNCHCLERRLLELKEQLQPVHLKEITKEVKLEYAPTIVTYWLCHFSLDLVLFTLSLSVSRSAGVWQERVEELNLNLESIRQLILGLDFCCETVLSCGSEEACLHVAAAADGDDMEDSLNVWNYKLIPKLLEVYVAGSKDVQSVTVTRDDRQELVLQVAASFQTLAGLGLDTVDWQRSSPFTVREVYDTFGVEAACQFIYERLMTITSSDVNPSHVRLLADYATHTGNVLGYTNSGFKEFLKSTGSLAPFQRVAVNELEAAAQNGLCDRLKGVVSSTAWGKRPPIGTSTDFKLVWKMDDPSWVNVDLYKFLEGNVCKQPLTPAIAEGRKMLNSEWESQPQGTTETNGWDVPSTTENLDSGWGLLTTTANVDNGWGSSTATADVDNGWGSSTTTAIGGSDWGSSATDTVKNATSTVNADNGWEAPNSGADQGNGWETSRSGVDQGNGWGASSSDAEVQIGWASIPSTDRPDVAEGREEVSWNTAFKDDSKLEEQRSKRSFAPLGCRRIPNPHLSEVCNDGWSSEPANKDEGGGWGQSSEVINGSTWDSTSFDAPAPAAQGRDSSDWLRNDDLELQEERPKRKFAPTGANTIPLGKRRVFPKLGVDSAKQDSGTDAKDVENNEEKNVDHGWTNSGWSPVKNDDQVTVAADIQVDGWGEAPNSGQTSIQDDGWAAAPNSGQPALQDDGWGAAPSSSQFSTQDDGWGAAPNSGVTSNDEEAAQAQGWGCSAPQEIEGAPKTSALHARDRPPPDPFKRKFWMEVVEVVNQARIVLRSYRNGDRLSEEHETAIMEKILVHHPSYDQKAGAGIDFLKVDRPAKFSDSSCFFVVRKDGSEDDFSYHKCLRSLVEKSFPENYLAKYDASCLPKDWIKKVDDSSGDNAS
ncbi:DNA-directed RNA polymerase V subunit 1 [Selaginella moellendorffii]|uniref:DNA-directed RNA polymerase V subunit 1 n=1 Tax=Selaginella moellendorffii TaxID=88036 RepID=UPI000D1C6C2F|nr:DNA-directed RNA polymerase V subunit 1 [Selaginella moellendorffii]|eukprot:XP_024529687.1 DNA-directed RNA polymerase V subunit 1 [Selaginella moellendorffii]